MSTNSQRNGENQQLPQAFTINLNEDEYSRIARAAKEGQSLSLNVECGELGNKEAIPAKVLIEKGIEIEPLGDEKYLIKDVPAADLEIILVYADYGDLSELVIDPSTRATASPTLPEGMVPDWFQGYDKDLMELMESGRLDRLDSWEVLVGSDLPLFFERINANVIEGDCYIPIMHKVGSDDILCITRPRDGSGENNYQLVHFEFPLSDDIDYLARYSSVSDFQQARDNDLAEEYQNVLRMVRSNPRYLEGINWGAPRPGHPEGTIASHISELMENLRTIEDDLSSSDFRKLELLIHCHDTFKNEASRGVPIAHPESHASLARGFIEEYLGESPLSQIVQLHDEMFALWKPHKGEQINQDRYQRLIETIEDWDLYVTFLLIDNSPGKKDFSSTLWAVRALGDDDLVDLSFDPLERFEKIFGSQM